jgi:hypothetical protein
MGLRSSQGCRNGIIAVRSPRVTAEETSDPQPGSGGETVGLNGLLNIMRTAWTETAAAVQSQADLDRIGQETIDLEHAQSGVFRSS